MRKLIISVVVAVASAAPAAAEVRYDRKLEQAVMDIVAEKMDELRDGFSHNEEPQFVAPRDGMITGSIGIETARSAVAAKTMEGNVVPPARKVSRIIAF